MGKYGRILFISIALTACAVSTVMGNAFGYQNPKNIIISQPSDETRITSSSHISILGACDYRYPLYMNGQKLPTTRNGFFTVYVELKEGDNGFTFTNNRETERLVITRKAAVAKPKPPVAQYYEKPVYGVVKSNYVTHRANPDLSPELLTPLAKGTALKIIGEIDGYYITPDETYIYKTTVDLIQGELPKGKITRGEVTQSGGLTYLTLEMNVNCFYSLEQSGSKATLKIHGEPEPNVPYPNPLGAQLANCSPMQPGLVVPYPNPFGIQLANCSPMQPGLVVPYPNPFGIQLANCSPMQPECQISVPPGTIIENIAETSDGNTVTYEINFNREPSGHFAEFKDGKMIVGFKHGVRDLKSAKVIIDPGHGGKDNGAFGPPAGRGPVEKDFNLKVALQAKKYLEGRGVFVMLTRSNDSALPLAQRVTKILEEKPDLSVSVHANSMPETSDFSAATGPLMFYSFDISKKAADQINAAFGESTGFALQEPIKENLALTRITNCPAILLEMGFLCNPEEYELLLQRGTLEQIGTALGQGIEKYLLEQEAGK